jgi:divalent metal cation (Fe/Co/Zn/Cd) transporter
MIIQLYKWFIKDYQEVSRPVVRERYGKLAGIVGIISNTFLFILKILIGTIYNSISITADAVNNLSDAGSSVITLIGFKLSGKPADEKHPYGHARA